MLRERFEAIRPYVAGRSVLDVGCTSRHRKPDWMHGLITEVASDIVGIDLAADALADIRRRRYDVR